MNIEAFKQDVADALDSGRRTATDGQPATPVLMTVYTSTYREREYENLYPNAVNIRNERDLAAAVVYDNMSSKMKGSHRKNENFIECNCLIADVDNTHSEEPADWVTEGDIADAFPFDYFLVRSRSYMKEKREVDKKTRQLKIEAPREKWHIYIPLTWTIREPAEFDRIARHVLAMFPYLDSKAIDRAHFFYGIASPHVTYEQNGQHADDYINGMDPAELRRIETEAIQDFSDHIARGDYDLEKNKKTVKVVFDFLGLERPGYAQESGGAPGKGFTKVPKVITSGNRNDFLYSLACSMQRQGFPDVAIHAAIQETNASVCDNPLDDKEINSLVKSALKWPKGEPYILRNPTPDRIENGWQAHKEARTYAEAAAYLRAQAQTQAPASEKEKEITSENSTETGAGNMDGTDTAAQAAATAGTEETPVKPYNVSDYIDNVMGDEMAAFGEAIPTGFANLDREAEGLYPGIYVLGAISSLGKTTFCLQLADQVAAAGRDVLFFTMEQSRLEIVSKSLARYTSKAGDSMRDYATSLEIRKGRGGALAWQAAELYKKDVADRMNVIPGGFGGDGAAPIETAADIVAYIDSYMRANHTKPVVFIDYLQILRATDPFDRGQFTTKGIVDTAITTFKRFSAKRGIAIVVVSSLNRTNYLVPIDYESFKESGGIEYTSDVVWGLQLSCINNPIFNDQNKGLKEKREMINQAKSETPRRVELVCLKNRNGKATYSCGFDYFPAFDTFVPSASDMTAAADISNSYTRRRRRF